MDEKRFITWLQQAASLYGRTLQGEQVTSYWRYLVGLNNMSQESFERGLQKACMQSPDFFPPAPLILKCARERPVGSPPVQEKLLPEPEATADEVRDAIASVIDSTENNDDRTRVPYGRETAGWATAEFLERARLVDRERVTWVKATETVNQQKGGKGDERGDTGAKT